MIQDEDLSCLTSSYEKSPESLQITFEKLLKSIFECKKKNLDKQIEI